MYDKVKSYIDRYSWVTYLIMAGVACLCCWIIYGGSSDNSSAVDNLERAQEQQCKSVEFNKGVTDSVERSASLNREAGERITRLEVYQQQASERIDESAKGLEQAEGLLARNAELIERVEQGYQAQQGNGATATPPTEHVGAD